jgi:uncharacterized spore protein YtfJ
VQLDEEVDMDPSHDDEKSSLSLAVSKLDTMKDVLTVKRVFGDAYELDGTTVIPVAALRGGGGGGEGDAPGAQASGSGAGTGFGVAVRPVGVFVVKDGSVTWSPSIDVMRVALGCQLVALAGVFMLGRVLSRRHRH